MPIIVYLAKPDANVIRAEVFFHAANPAGTMILLFYAHIHNNLSQLTLEQ